MQLRKSQGGTHVVSEEVICFLELPARDFPEGPPNSSPKVPVSTGMSAGLTAHDLGG